MTQQHAPVPPVDAAVDLFAAADPVLDTTFRTARRTALDATSWVEHAPGWLQGSAALFDELRQHAPWEQRHRMMYGREVQEPRLTAEYDDPSAAPPLLRDVVAALREHYGTPYRRMWLNLYPDHRGSTGWHGDAIGKVQATSTVPVLSLGATRRFLIRPTAGGTSTTLVVAAGDLVVMGGRAQRDFRHCVPKQATPAGPRISVNFAPDLGPG